jgi:hypothetical protein
MQGQGCPKPTSIYMEFNIFFHGYCSYFTVWAWKKYIPKSWAENGSRFW